MTGKIKSFNRVRSYGFITGEDNKEYFFHSTSLEDSRTARSGEIVIFKARKTDKGLRAIHIRRVNEE